MIKDVYLRAYAIGIVKPACENALEAAHELVDKLNAYLPANELSSRARVNSFADRLNAARVALADIAEEQLREANNLYWKLSALGTHYDPTPDGKPNAAAMFIADAELVKSALGYVVDRANELEAAVAHFDDMISAVPSDAIAELVSVEAISELNVTLGGYANMTYTADVLAHRLIADVKLFD